MPDREKPALERAEALQLTSGLAAYRWGAGAARRLLFIHGWDGRPTQLAALLEPLLALGFEVIGLDAPAHGRSPGRTAHPVAFAEALLAIDREFGPFDAVIGHSMGAGATVLALAEGLRAGRAVLVAPPGAIDQVLRRFAGFIGLPPRATDRFLGEIEGHVGRPAVDVSANLLAPRVGCPVLVIHDRSDREVPFADGQAVADALPQATLHVTEGLGHRRILRDPGVARKIAEFVANSSG